MPIDIGQRNVEIHANAERGCRKYLDRALEYEEQPPDEPWNAVEVFQKKMRAA
jgi:hypothetical protein